MGRPSKLTKEMIDLVVLSIRKGNYVETSAAYAGVSKQTLYTWLKAARSVCVELGNGSKKLGDLSKHERLLVEFLDAVERGMAEAEIRDVSVVGQSAASGDWRAAAWRLERKFPKKYGLVQRQEHSGIDGSAIVVDDLRGMTNEELRERMEILGRDGE